MINDKGTVFLKNNLIYFIYITQKKYIWNYVSGCCFFNRIFNNIFRRKNKHLLTAMQTFFQGSWFPAIW
jgi:hypothetical protein